MFTKVQCTRSWFNNWMSHKSHSLSALNKPASQIPSYRKCWKWSCNQLLRFVVTELGFHRTPWSIKNRHPFSFYCFFYKCWPIAIIFGAYTLYKVNLQHKKLLISPPHLCTAATLLSGKFSSTNTVQCVWTYRAYQTIELLQHETRDVYSSGHTGSK